MDTPHRCPSYHLKTGQSTVESVTPEKDKGQLDAVEVRTGLLVPKPLSMHGMAKKGMVDIATTVDQALLDAAEWVGVSVWAVIAAIAVALLLVLILAFHCVRRGSPIKIYATRGEVGDDPLEFVERTLVEFPADRIKIEADRGKVIIKLVSAKPVAVEEPLLPQEVKEEPLLAKVEEPKPPEEKPSKSEPIPLGAVESESEEEKTK